MKSGYQDCGAWTLLDSTPVERRQAAWLYAQFTTCKTVSLKKTLVGLTPIRESDLNSQAMAQAAPRLGGLVEFYRSPARVMWTPTATTLPTIRCWRSSGGRGSPTRAAVGERRSR